MPFKKFGLCDELVQGILATGYTAPTEIQAEAIPIAIDGKDMIGCAQTGTGKTAAFVLPILNRLATVNRKSKNKKLRSLIITPTRELAIQIDKSVRGYGRFIKMNSLAVYGGSSIETQIKALRRGVDIIAATPGRLLDHIQRRTIDLSTVEILVLDEADRMLDMGFINDIKKILEKIPNDRQTLLFSATMSKDVTNLTKNIQRSPKMIQIGRQHNPIETITQYIYPVPREQKMDLLLHMIEQQQMYSVLIFSRTKRGADRICRNLKHHNITAEAIHSDRTQSQRLRALEGFKSGKYLVMVATDIAARGINVEGISHVFNFDVPAFPEDYVHRIGRTGRAEATGDAVTFVSYDEIPLIHDIERFISRQFKETYYEGFDYKQKLSLINGPKSGKSTKKKKFSSARPQRNQPKPHKPKHAQPKPAAQSQKSKSAESQHHKSKPTTARVKKADFPDQADSRPGKNKPTKNANAKKSFKRKHKKNRNNQPVGPSFNRSKKKSAKKKKHHP
ncbi:MAG: DEAD/DEAH box helicase [Sedimentisphaerales bacterium]|nr:DEAD/DEAH box helicase [Sedimentisphaerales bacterium]